MSKIKTFGSYFAMGLLGASCSNNALVLRYGSENPYETACVGYENVCAELDRMCGVNSAKLPAVDQTASCSVQIQTLEGRLKIQDCRADQFPILLNKINETLGLAQPGQPQTLPENMQEERTTVGKIFISEEKETLCEEMNRIQQNCSSEFKNSPVLVSWYGKLSCN